MGSLVEPLAELLVVASVAALVLRHLRQGVFALALQGLTLALLVHLLHPGPAGWLSVGLVVVAKVVLVPYLLLRTARLHRAFEASESVSRWVYPGIFAALLAVRSVDPLAVVAVQGASPALALLLPAGLGMMLLGLVALATRSLLPSQMLGISLTENGVYATGVALTHGLPLVLDGAIVLDLVLALVLLAWLTGRIRSVWGHLDAEQLDRLRG